jgi:hypothetical protein
MRRINTITFTEVGNSNRYTVALPDAIGEFHQHLIDAIRGGNTRFGQPRRRNAIVESDRQIPDLTEMLINAINEQQPNPVNTIPVYKAEGVIGECSICQETIKNGDSFRRLPCSETVNHCFHQACIDPWLERNSTCPNCRVDLFSG